VCVRGLANIAHERKIWGPTWVQNPSKLNWPRFCRLAPTRAAESTRLWRKRVGVEPTPESAKDTGYGFEDHEDHRALCASASSIEEVSARAQGGLSQTLNPSNALRDERGSVACANERSNKIVKCSGSADFVVTVLGGTTDFSVRKQLAREGFAEDQKLDGFT
jgi:hypothetical protein